jgi:hypothetical protein
MKTQLQKRLGCAVGQLPPSFSHLSDEELQILRTQLEFVQESTSSTETFSAIGPYNKLIAAHEQAGSDDGEAPAPGRLLTLVLLDSIGYMSGLYRSRKIFTTSPMEEGILYEVVNNALRNVPTKDWSATYKKSIKWVVRIKLMFFTFIYLLFHPWLIHLHIARQAHIALARNSLTEAHKDAYVTYRAAAFRAWDLNSIYNGRTAQETADTADEGNTFASLLSADDMSWLG